jgi:tetratricopeptide (TPR) repeat protein
MSRSFFIIAGFLIFSHLFPGSIHVYGQENEFFKSSTKDFHFGMDLFENELYKASIREFEEYRNEQILAVFPKHSNQLRESELISAMSRLRADAPEAEKELRFTIERYYPDPITTNAILELASWYYNNKLYHQSIEMYSKIEIDNLDPLLNSEAAFKKGYSYFVLKDFKAAKDIFYQTIDYRNIFYYTTNYYYGLCLYYEGNYTEAIESFRKVDKSVAYNNYIPYYLTQLYFIQKDYDRLISYAEQKLSNPELKNRNEIRLLLGQAYFNKNEYSRALPHLLHYEQNTKYLTADEFYQLAFTQYQLGKCNDAIPSFLELTNLENKMGQISNYYLGDCYLKNDDKLSARAAFKKVSQMPFDKSMQEEALFNYGKISSDLAYDREAVNVLIEVPEKSPYFEEAQVIINDILVNSGDFANSIDIIESLPSISINLQKTYQRVTLKRGMQLFSEAEYQKSREVLEKSLKYLHDKNYQARATYWLAIIAHQEAEYDYSIRLFNDFFSLAPEMYDLPEESSLYMANYTMGYNHIKMKQYNEAELYFKNALVGISLELDNIQNQYILDRVIPDAYIRAGDCLFQQRKLQEANMFYNEAVKREQGAFVYAKLQQATIEGLMGEPYKKLLLLERIKANHPDSEFADDALMMLGETYLELGSREPAAKSFNELVIRYEGRTPYFNKALLRLGLISFNAGDTQAALGYYRNAIMNNPSPAERNEAMRALEEIYIEDLKDEAAYFALLDSVPGFELSIFEKDSLTYKIAENFFLEAEYDKAEMSFENYLKSYPRGYFRIDAYYNLAESLTLLKKYREALQNYEKVIESGYSIYYNRSLKKAAIICYNYTQNFKKALNYYSLYEETTTDENEIFFAQIGALRSAFRAGLSNSVIQYANKVNANPLATQDERATALYYLGKVYYNQEKYDQALPLFNQVDKMANNFQAAESRFLVAEIYYKQGKYEESEKHAIYTNEKNRNYPYWIARSLILLSDLFVLKKDYLNASAALEAVLENFKDDESLLKIATDKLAEVKKLEQGATRVRGD